MNNEETHFFWFPFHQIHRKSTIAHQLYSTSNWNPVVPAALKQAQLIYRHLLIILQAFVVKTKTSKILTKTHHEIWVSLSHERESMTWIKQALKKKLDSFPIHPIQFMKNSWHQISMLHLAFPPNTQYFLVPELWTKKIMSSNLQASWFAFPPNTQILFGVRTPNYVLQ